MNLYSNLPISGASIRLLELEDGDDDSSEICLKMNTYPIHQELKYDALSYAWGTKHETFGIKINGHEISVTGNLHDALQQFRNNQRKKGVSLKRLWVDALCIQQSDNAEKSAQLNLMTDIYAKAHCVLVWLGKPDDSSELAFDTLQIFAAEHSTSDGKTTLCSTRVLNRLHERRLAISRFIRQTYFDRVWIIQEVMVAQTVVVFCGSFSIAFDDLYSACQKMTGSGFFSYSVSGVGRLAYLGDWRRFFQESSEIEREGYFDIKLFVD
jgi:hypothetical protein